MKLILSAIFALIILGLFVYYTSKFRERKIREALLKFKKIPEVMVGLDPFTFELWVRQLFLEIGADAALSKREAKTGFDHGIDLVVNYKGQKICVQCKKYYFKHIVGETILRDLYGAKFHGGFDKAIIVTTSSFTRRAQEWASGKKDMILINGAVLQRIKDEPKLLVDILDR